MSLECYVDVDFAGGWNIRTSADADNVMSGTGLVITYANYPIYWASCLQTEIALSTAKAEYIAMSSALRKVIQLMTTLPMHINKPNFFCKVHENNQSTIKMVASDKLTPQTKNIALKYPHFCSHYKNGHIEINYCPTEDQKADLLTKALTDAALSASDTCSLVGNSLMA
jgi:hypothetical protein